MANDSDLHAAKKELAELIARMRNSPHASAFLGYADALVYAASVDLAPGKPATPVGPPVLRVVNGD